MNRTYQVDFSALVRVGMVEEVASARFNQIARHFDVVVSEVQQQHLETVESVGARVQAKLGQLTDETDDFHFGLDVDLVLLTVPGGGKFTLNEILFERTGTGFHTFLRTWYLKSCLRKLHKSVDTSGMYGCIVAANLE